MTSDTTYTANTNHGHAEKARGFLNRSLRLIKGLHDPHSIGESWQRCGMVKGVVAHGSVVLPDD
jgi:hypothetical protein